MPMQMSSRSKGKWRSANIGSEMINRERALELWKWYPGNKTLELIERTLDEKDKEWADALIDALKDEPMKLMNARKEGFIEGQKEMRERAAKATEEDCHCTGDDHGDECPVASPWAYIRALPIEGEK